MRAEVAELCPVITAIVAVSATTICRFTIRSGLESDQIHTTSFVAVVGPQTVWPGSTPTAYKDLDDGSHDTLLVVEVPDGQFLWM